MNGHIYTKREMRIIGAADCPHITDEEFLSLFNKAVRLEDAEVISRLYDQYQDVARRVFSPEFEDRHRDIADMEYLCCFPILIMTKRNTSRRIMNIVAYLIGKTDVPEGYMERLQKIPYRLAYNYLTAEYVEDYLEKPLWDQFFIGDERLRHLIETRSIKDLEELFERSAAYFEGYVGRYQLCEHDSCERCQRRWMENYKKACYEPAAF